MIGLSKIEKVKSIVNELGGTIQNEDDINWGVYLRILDCDGYRYYTKTDSILCSRTLGSRFAKSNPNSIDNIKLYLSKKGIIDVELLSTVYESEDKKLALRCSCGEIFYRDWGHIKQSERLKCEKCAYKSNRRMKFDFVQKVFEDNGLILLDKELNGSNYYSCETKDGYKCLCYLWNIKKGIKADPFRENNPFFFENFKKYVSRNSTSKLISVGMRQIQLQCCCGQDFSISRARFWNSSLRCDLCKRKLSTNEIMVKNYLDSIGERYIRQYRFVGCRDKRPLPFDFYLPQRDICIEVQGEQHYFEIPIWVNRGGLNGTQMRDAIKRDFCAQNEISLVEISYKEIKDKSYIDKLNKILKPQ